MQAYFGLVTHWENGVLRCGLIDIKKKLLRENLHHLNTHHERRDYISGISIKAYLSRVCVCVRDELICFTYSAYEHIVTDVWNEKVCSSWGDVLTCHWEHLRVGGGGVRFAFSDLSACNKCRWECHLPDDGGNSTTDMLCLIPSDSNLFEWKYLLTSNQSWV